MKSLPVKAIAAISALFLAFVVSASAQTNGTLTPTTTSYNWSTAPWAPGPYPDGGGTATFLPFVAATPGTLAGTTTITFDVSPTLGEIDFYSPFSTTLQAGAGSLIAASTGLTLNVVNSAANTPTLFQLTNSITAPISGGGTAGITKIGSGIVTLAGANTYTGGTHFNGGEMVLSGSNGDSTLGATGAGNGLSFNGGSLFNNITGGLTTSRDVFLDSGGGTLYLNTAMTINGVVSGNGSLNDYGFAAVALTLTNTNTYTGATITSGSTVSALTLSGNGSITTTSGYDLAGTLTLSNTATNLNDRISDTAGITSRGATISLLGNASAATSENAGIETLASGSNTITVTPNAAQSASLNFAGITRTNNAALFVRGTSLGAAPGANVGTITATGMGANLIGGGGGPGSTTISIIPWAIGNTSATALTNSSLVTYDATNGFRPLALTEYAGTLGLNSTDNVRLTAAATAPAGGSTANALVIATSGALSGTGTINVTSGAVLYSTGTASNSETTSAPLNFGTAEGVLSSTNTGTWTISGPLSGSGGLTLNAVNSGLITLSGANTYTGTTTLLDGYTTFSGTVANDGVTAGAFGLSTTAIVMNPGTNFVLLEATAASTFNRSLSVQGGPGLAYFGALGGAYVLTMNGNINLQNNLTLLGGSSAANSMVVNGTISGTGQLQDYTSAYYVTLNGNNNYSGGTNLQTGIYTLGSDTAFGTGTVFESSSTGTGGTILASAARTIANNFFLSATETFGGTNSMNFTGNVNLNGGRTISVTDTAGATFSGVVSNGSLTKTGTGEMSLNSASGNTYTGGTVLGTNVGALNVNNSSGSGTGAGAVSIGATSTSTYSSLSGSFNISGATSIAGHLSPGNSGTSSSTAGVNAIGSANFGSSLTLSSSTTSTLTMELASSSSFDKITVAGAFTLAGTVNVTTIGGFVAQAGQSFDLIDWGSITVGTFTLNTSGAATAPGTSWDTSTFTTDGTIRVIPEPATVALFVAGGLSLFVAARRRRA